MKPAPSAKPKVRYGITFKPITIANGQVVETPDWMIEKQVLQNYEKLSEFPNNQLKPWCWHFTRLVDLIFGDPKGIFYFQWNPNSMRILRAFHDHPILAIAGHASSGKTEACALIAAMMFWLSPKDTQVLVTSTTVSASQSKVWGKVKQVWNHMVNYFGQEQMPGKLIDSKNKIRYQEGDISSELSGITLVVGEKSQSKESANKIQGIKQKNVILIGDEFATLEESLVKTALTNLTSNANFRMLATFNPESYYDPGGIVSRPKDGWHTVTEHMDEWETLIEPYGIKGYCIRFDGLKSPNVVAGEVLWKGLLTREYMDSFSHMGTTTKAYYTMFRGFWVPGGTTETIYSAPDIHKWGAQKAVTTWADKQTMVAALDPAFAHGGDKAVLVIAKCGMATITVAGETNVRGMQATADDQGNWQVLQRVFEMTHMYVLDEDITNTTESKTEWVVRLTKQKLRAHGVSVQNFACDATGGGEPFAALLARDIGQGFLNIKFGGRASEHPVSRLDKRKGCDRFKNMVSEVWYVGRDLIRTGQLKGLHPDVQAEMVIRTYEERGGVVQVEPKDEMKKRTNGKSPDKSDAAFMALHLARVRLGLSSNEQAARQPAKPRFSQNSLFGTFDPNKKTQQETTSSRFLSAGGGWASGKV